MASSRKQRVLLGKVSESRNEDNTGGTPPLDRQQRDTAEYVCEMVLQLRDIVKAAKLYGVAVRLEYAYYEAFSVANRTEPSRDEATWIKQLDKAHENPDDVPEVPSSVKERDDD